jgi:hypothetical protein
MVFKMRNILIVVLFLVVTSIISASFAHFKTQNDAVFSHVNTFLQFLNIDMDLLEYWQKNLNRDHYLEERIKYLVLTKLILLSKIKPDIDKLKGEPLEALNRAIVYNNSYNLSIKENDPVFKDVQEYLKTIQNAVTIRMRQKDEIFKNALKKD